MRRVAAMTSEICGDHVGPEVEVLVAAPRHRGVGAAVDGDGRAHREPAVAQTPSEEADGAGPSTLTVGVPEPQRTITARDVSSPGLDSRWTAPAGTRRKSPGPAQTRLSGVRFCEHLPKLATSGRTSSRSSARCITRPSASSATNTIVATISCTPAPPSCPTGRQQRHDHAATPQPLRLAEHRLDAGLRRPHAARRRLAGRGNSPRQPDDLPRSRAGNLRAAVRSPAPGPRWARPAGSARGSPSAPGRRPASAAGRPTAPCPALRSLRRIGNSS